MIFKKLKYCFALWYTWMWCVYRWKKRELPLEVVQVKEENIEEVVWYPCAIPKYIFFHHQNVREKGLLYRKQTSVDRFQWKCCLRTYINITNFNEIGQRKVYFLNINFFFLLNHPPPPYFFLNIVLSPCLY